MQQKLLRKAGLLGIILTAVGVYLAGCVDEPNPPVPPEMESSVRFIHALQNTTAVDIWIDDERLVSNATYKTATVYFSKIKAGNRLVCVVPSGGSDTTGAIFRRLITFRSFMKMTGVFYENAGTLDFLLTQERFTYSNEWNKLAGQPIYDSLGNKVGDLPDSAAVKLIHVNTSDYIVKLVKDSLTGPMVIGPIEANSLSPYTTLVQGTYKFYFLSIDDSEMKIVDFTLEPKKRYSFILVGDLQNPEVLTLIDDPV